MQVKLNFLSQGKKNRHSLFVCDISSILQALSACLGFILGKQRILQQSILYARQVHLNFIPAFS